MNDDAGLQAVGAVCSLLFGVAMVVLMFFGCLYVVEHATLVIR